MSLEDSLDVQPPVSLRGVYCTVVAQNYLPQALALYSSIRDAEPDRDIVILVIDGDRSDLEAGRPRLTVANTSVLNLSEREIDILATIYDVVEFSTAVKPLFLRQLLSTYDQAIYLDPDTFVVSPLAELESLVDEFGIVLTPHFLKPIEPGDAYISEVHSLTVGVHNLGFCAVGLGGIPFLDWWWSHLQRECLIYPLLGIFVDQKWTDIGVMLYGANSLRHPGYNVGPWNLHERAFRHTEGEWRMNGSGEPLRLYHFSGFNPDDPDAISTRLNTDMRKTDAGSEALSSLSQIYAERVLAARKLLGPAPRYKFDRDSRGKVLKKRTRRAYRKAVLAQTAEQSVPSPFRPDEARAFREWKRKAWGSRIGISVGDAAIAIKYAFPDEYNLLKRRLPTQFGWLRGRLLRASPVRR